MTDHTTPPGTRFDLLPWAKRMKVDDLLGQHISQLCPYIRWAAVAKRMEMAPPHATIHEVVAQGRLQLAFLDPRMERPLLAAAVSHLRLHAERRLQARRREQLWRTPLPTPALAELSARLQALFNGLEAGFEPMSLFDELDLDEDDLPAFPSPRSLRFDQVGLSLTAAFARGYRYTTTTLFLQQEDAVEPHWSCSCEHDEEGCEHARFLLGWLLDDLHVAESQLRPTLARVVGQPAWQRLLDQLDTLLPQVTAAAAPAGERVARAERCVWRLAHDDLDGTFVTPLVQKRTAAGGWSRGRQLGRRELSPAHPAAADEDRRALEVLDHAAAVGYDEPPVGELCAALCGHPALSTAEPPHHPVELRRSPLRLGVVPAGDGDRLVLGVAFGDAVRHGATLAAADTGGGWLVAPDRGGRVWHVVQVPEPLYPVVHILTVFSNVALPATALEPVLRRLASLGPHVEIHVDPALVGQRDTLPPAPAVDLAPLADGGLELRLGILPPGREDALLVPGQGSPQLVGVTPGGAPAVVDRDLAAEQAVAEAVAGRLGLAPADRRAAWSWRVAEPAAALDLLHALQQLGDEVVVRWPEGVARLRVARATPSSLRLRVGRKGRLFEIGGEVEVDGSTVSLVELLAAVRRGERYVRLGPTAYARLEDELRARLSSADRVAAGDSAAGLTAGAFTVTRLAELLGDEVTVDGDGAFRDLLARVAVAGVEEPALPAGLATELRPYQRHGYRWLARLASWQAGAVLADDMGLGKTVQALALLLARAAEGPALVVAPTSVCAVWAAEAARFAPGLEVRLYRGAEREALLDGLGPGTVLVTSYGVLTLDVERLRQIELATLVVDEAQAIKNPATRRAQAVRAVTAEVAVALTGTPLENHLGDLWSIFRVTNPGLLGSWQRFRERFAAPIERAGDAAALADLRALVRPFLLRRTKAVVAPELPPRTEVVRWVQLGPAERALYEQARREILERLGSGAGDEERFAILAAITRLRQLACHPRLVDPASPLPSAKLEAAVEMIGDLVRDGQRALVFSQFTSHLALLREELDRRRQPYLYLDGGTPAEQRDRLVASWREGRAALFLISLKAGGAGLNLMGADSVLHLDPWWNPAVEDQATDRTHRIGQPRPVTVVRFIAEATIEEAVLELHAAKRELARGVLEGAEAAAALSAAELVELIRAAGDGEPGGAEEAEPAAADDDLEEGDEQADHAGDVAGRVRPAARRTTARRPRPRRAVPPTGPPCGLAELESLCSRLRAQLDREVAERRLSEASARTYLRVADRFLRFAATEPDGGGPRRRLADWSAAYLNAAAAGTFAAPASDRPMLSAVIRRLERLAAHTAE